MIELNLGGKTAEESFGVSEKRAKEIFYFIADRLEQMTNPTQDLEKIQSFCTSDKEFVYAVLHYGVGTGYIIRDDRRSRGNIFDKIRNLFG